MTLPANKQESAPSIDDDQQLRGLIARIRARDDQALASLYDLTLGRVYGLILRVVRQPADAEEGIPHDEEAPPLAHDLEALRHRAVHVLEAGAPHEFDDSWLHDRTQRV